MALTIRPLTLKEANAHVATFHRHHKPCVGHRFSLACFDGERLCGVAICGRPVARGCDPYLVLEVSRLCTDGTHNACSCLYAACARAAQAMGFKRIQTYILESETGASLKASGYAYAASTSGGDWNHSKANRGTRRTDQPMVPKQRWERELN